MRRFASVFKRKPDELHTDSSSSRASDSLCSSTDDDHALKQPRWKAWLTPRRVKHSKQPRQQPQRPAPASLSDYVLVDNEHTASATATTSVAVSPFTRMPNAPLFPRSVNSSAALAPSPSLRIHILKSNLAKHPPSFDRPPLLPQSATPASAHPSISLPSDINIPYPPKPTHIYSASPGLRHWITRPCFEERYSVYLPAAHAIQPHPVSASRAVAALEYSEHLDAMVDPDLSLSHSHPTLSASFADSSSQLSHASLPDQLAGSSVTHRPSYATTPSPLRIEHNPTPPSPQPLVQQSKLQAQPVVKPKTDVKRVVRFAEDGDDPDDGLPLHIIRMRKKREEKANFLRAEQARREQQERAERHRLDIERRRQEQEALEKERRRIAKEKEKRDRDAAAYAEAVVASRLRIEAQRAGGVPSSSNSPSSNNLLPPSPSFSSLRESERNKPPSETRRSATMPIPRRDPSDLRINLRVSDPPSPASSRPPSLAHSPASPATFGPNSRPPSTYSSSSEDARQSRRHSAMTSPIPVKPMVVSYPTWSGSNPNLHYMPPVPMFPQYIHDMPLLPPAAPFMKSYDKRSLRGSSPGHSSSASSRRGSINSSTERVNIMNSPASRSTSAIVGKPSYQQQPYPGSPSSSPRRSEFGKDTHQRRSSNDSKPKTPPSSYFASHHQTPRGRQHSTPSSPGPQYLVAPNPWTALPTQNGGLPYSMPVSSYTHHVGGGGMGSGRKEGRKMTIS